MRTYGSEYRLKKIISEEIKGVSSFNSFPYFKFIHKILNTLNISLLILVFVLFIISLNSQRQWSKTFNNLSRTIEYNNNLIDYISKTEEFYLSKHDSSKNFKKTSPEDLIYLENILPKGENFFNSKFKAFFIGLKNSRYQRGY